MPLPFRQRRYFYYLSGFNEPDAHLTYDTKTDELVLFIRPLNPREVLWSGMPPNKEECLKRYNVDRVETSVSLEQEVIDFVQRSPGGTIFIIHDHVPPLPKLNSDAYTINTTLLQPIMNLHRVYKDSFEIDLIRRANQISLEAHKAVHALAPKAKNESELQATFEQVCTANMAKVQAYEPICASGRNCATLHYVRNDQPLEGKQLALIDSSCEYQCYASDITRTFPINGQFTPEAKAIYDLVAKMQKECISWTAPGIAWGETHYRAHKIATKGLLDLGILKGASAEKLYLMQISKAFFPHGLGHFIGLDVHDVEEPSPFSVESDYDPDFEVLGNSFTEDDGTVYNCEIPLEGMGHWAKTHIMYPRILRPNMVLTVEPGIYFCEWIIKDYLNHPLFSQYIDTEVLEKYWDVGGVRLENCILVTKDGNEDLTTGETINAKMLGWERRYPKTFPLDDDVAEE